jgi:hypothetical protein
MRHPLQLLPAHPRVTACAMLAAHAAQSAPRTQQQPLRIAVRQAAAAAAAAGRQPCAWHAWHERRGLVHV